MRMYDILEKKKNKLPLTNDEIAFFINGYVSGVIPDYQMSSMLMAICINGMEKDEIKSLTLNMAYSGEIVDLSMIEGIKVDKHSTGGIGDKTTIIISPIVASCGVPVAKMSGRGLGYTGGTIDKLESVPGLKTAFTHQEFIDNVNKHMICLAGQSGNLAPADKKIYALRDITATVDSIPLIAASIMSKKIAAGSDCILLDVKAGSGAFMKNLDDATSLAKTMVEIGEAAGKKTVALITDMNIPLGNNIGNSLEIIEAVDVLKGKGPDDLTYICVELAKNMLYLAGKGSLEMCEELVLESIKSGKALEKLIEMVKAQSGDEQYISDTSLFKQAEVVQKVKSPCNGFITSMNAQECGVVSVMLGAGRELADSIIDCSAGIQLCAKTGDFVSKGQPLAIFHTDSQEKIAACEERFVSAITYSETNPEKQPLIYARIEKDGDSWKNLQ